MKQGNNDQRAMTYQVGWRKGKIAWHDGAASTNTLAKQTDEALAEGQRRLSLLWREAPSIPASLLLPLLYALPALCFILTIVLVYGLRYGS